MVLPLKRQNLVGPRGVDRALASANACSLSPRSRIVLGDSRQWYTHTRIHTHPCCSLARARTRRRRLWPRRPDPQSKCSGFTSRVVNDPEYHARVRAAVVPLVHTVGPDGVVLQL